MSSCFMARQGNRRRAPPACTWWIQILMYMRSRGVSTFTNIGTRNKVSYIWARTRPSDKCALFPAKSSERRRSRWLWWRRNTICLQRGKAPTFAMGSLVTSYSPDHLMFCSLVFQTSLSIFWLLSKSQRCFVFFLC